MKNYFPKLAITSFAIVASTHLTNATELVDSDRILEFKCVIPQHYQCNSKAVFLRRFNSLSPDTYDYKVGNLFDIFGGDCDASFTSLAMGAQVGDDEIPLPDGLRISVAKFLLENRSTHSENSDEHIGLTITALGILEMLTNGTWIDVEAEKENSTAQCIGAIRVIKRVTEKNRDESEIEKSSNFKRSARISDVKKVSNSNSISISDRDRLAMAISLMRRSSNGNSYAGSVVEYLDAE